MISYTYTATGVKLSQALQTGKGGISTRRDYAGPFVFVNNAPGWVATPHGRFIYIVDGWQNEFHLRDHLGNTRRVMMEEDTGTLATLQQNHYYPFGMLIPSLSTTNTIGALKDNRYLYNGKEFNDDFELNWHDYGARFYDAQIARWHSVDPLAEKYYPISPYAYVANNPLMYIDPDGRQISFSYQYQQDEDGNYVLNEDGNKILTGVTMHLTGVVMNVSSKSANLDAAARRISRYIEKSFQGIMTDGLTFTTDVNLRVVESMSEVNEDDHIFAIADMGPVRDNHGNALETPKGAANIYGGKVAFIDVDFFRGPWDRTIGNVGPNIAAHEFGHLSLSVPPGTHSSGPTLMNDGFGIKNWWMFSNNVPSEQLTRIYRAYRLGLLNQGINWELGPRLRKRPARGIANPVVVY